MSKITIVTAFYDIGRGNWTTSTFKNGGPLPHYLQRSVDKYVDHFSRMCEIDADIIVYTSTDLSSRLRAISDTIKIVEYDYFNLHDELRSSIEKVQTSSKFLSMINPNEIRNPEYWSKDYVGVTSLKAHFVNDAFERNLISNEWAAWVDFGYCRDHDHIPISKKWEYNFSSEKMHLFNYRRPDLTNPNREINLAVLNNIVYIIGGVFVGQQKLWKLLAESMKNSLELLMKNNLVDDDQGLLLMSYFMNPEKYELHEMPLNAPLEDVRSILRKFNIHE